MNVLQEFSLWDLFTQDVYSAFDFQLATSHSTNGSHFVCSVLQNCGSNISRMIPTIGQQEHITGRVQSCHDDPTVCFFDQLTSSNIRL